AIAFGFSNNAFASRPAGRGVGGSWHFVFVPAIAGTPPVERCFRCFIGTGKIDGRSEITTAFLSVCGGRRVACVAWAFAAEIVDTTGRPARFFRLAISYERRKIRRMHWLGRHRFSILGAICVFWTVLVVSLRFAQGIPFFS